ncbi:Zinc finger ZZ-type [Penicillium herquei]|nr:Zinc finger ZZ-type [Penicillium herquei]
MATPALPSHPSPDHLITIKVLFKDNTRRFKLPLKDLRPQVLPQKIRTLLGVPADVNVILERYSDSAGSYILLDSGNQTVYKQLYRAAKAKSKLRIKATAVEEESTSTLSESSTSAEPLGQNPPRYSYLETVLSPPMPVASVEDQPATSNPVIDLTGGQVELPNHIPEPVAEPQYRKFEMEPEAPRFPVISHQSATGMFCIDCNNCGRSIASEHYHCSICEYGDYDLCPHCVKDGVTCHGEGHWLIKRTVEEGTVTTSSTETIPPRQSQVQETKPLAESVEEAHPKIETPVPVVAPSHVTAPAPAPYIAPVSQSLACPDAAEEKPICNGCCREADDSNLVRCNECEDYDLCLRCLLRNKHGHHPAHTFALGSDRNYCLKNLILSRCLPGRLFKHAAICDGCEKNIVGTRHKCLSCPDWDYCPDCVVDASQTHPGHRFAPLYESIGDQIRESHEIHYGIFCDGPLCKDKPAQSYIAGVRYKCAVCDDVDFCASCEALPTHTHNRTHPMIKFKTPVRSVTVSTLTEDVTGRVAMGDRVHYQAPVEAEPEAEIKSEISEEKEPIVEEAPVEAGAPEPNTYESNHDSEYQAYFLRDTIADGTQLSPDTPFRQTWTLYNPGPNSWPVGSDVRFVGGDTMFNVDSEHPSSVQSIHSAMESNKLAEAVKPGNTANFTVSLRTPHREGTAISYWRLKLPNGTPIGHRLWCDIQVQSTVVSEPVAPVSDVPESEASSRMIFPKLEKESPETSTHEAMPTVCPAPTISTTSEADILEDVESLTLDDTDTDAGFLTDEEYDVLDASDQEFLEAQQSVH